jgi:hypothetical protein
MEKATLWIIVLTLCVPIYANTAVLVYTVNLDVRPWLVDFNEVNLDVADAKTVFKMQAAMIFAVNTNTLETVVPSAEQSPVLILIGKDADGIKLNYMLTGDESSVSFIPNINTRTGRTFVVANWCFGDSNWLYSTMGSVGAYGSAMVNVTTKSGLVSVSVPSTLRGMGTLQKGSDNPLFLGGAGDGTVAAFLNSSLTRQVNESGNGTVQAAMELVARKLPPEPNPLTWIQPPIETFTGNGYKHTMECCEVNDPNPPILYRFVCLDNSSVSSPWQEGTSYMTSVGNRHHYRWYVIAKDGFGNTTSKSNVTWVQQQ